MALCEPPLPISLRLSSLYSNQGGVGSLVVSFINSHLRTCTTRSCTEPSCVYFHWFLRHRKNCKTDNCPSCLKLHEWISLHTEGCTMPSECPLDQLCQNMKKLQLKDSFRQRNSDIGNIIQRTNHHRSSSTSNHDDDQCPSLPGSPLPSSNQLAATHNGHASLATSAHHTTRNGNQIDQFDPHGSGNGCYHDCTPSDRTQMHSQQNGRLGNEIGTVDPACSSLKLRKSHDFSDNRLSSPYREAPTTFAPQDVSFPDEPMSFARHTSISSTSSLGGRYMKPPQSEGALVNEQREFIRRVIAMSKGGDEGEGPKGCGQGDGSLTRLTSLTSQASCGDAAISRLASMESRPSISKDPSLGMAPVRGQSPNDPYMDVAAGQGQSPGVAMVKRSSNHKLVKMSNISSVDLYPSNSPPPPPIHHPIQREQSDLNRRFVRGGMGSSVTMRAHPPIHNQSDDDEEGAGSGQEEAWSQQEEAGPSSIQRVCSLSDSNTKMLLSRTSIGLDQYNNIRTIQEKLMREQLHQSSLYVSNQSSQSILTSSNQSILTSNQSILTSNQSSLTSNQSSLTNHTSLLNQSNLITQSLSNRSSRQSYDMSEISTTPSPNLLSSGDTSQLNSLEDSNLDSGTGDLSQQGHRDREMLAHLLPSPEGVYNRSPPYEGGGDWGGDDRTPSIGHASSLSTVKDCSGNYQSLSSSHDHTPVLSDHAPVLHPPVLKDNAPSLRDWGGDDRTPSIGHASSLSTVKDCSGNYQSLSSSHDHTPVLSDHAPVLHPPVLKDNAPSLQDPSRLHDLLQSDHYSNDTCSHGNCYLDPHIFSHQDDSSDHASSQYNYTHHDSISDSECGTGWTGSTSLTSLPPPQSSLTRDEIVKMTETIDRVREEYKDDIENMINRREILTQKSPLFSPDSESQKVWPKPPRTLDVHGNMDTPSQFPNMEMMYYRKTMELMDEGKESEEEVTRREDLRKYLQGQFSRKQVYREGTHWLKQTVLGKGGQATCYSILDRATNLSLALKEETEDDKSLDEAYICLKLAHELNVTRNIVEYFGAAMLPSHRGNIVQLFMEIMPTSMQSYLFRNGPLNMADVHHFSFQLFDALEYLHNKEQIIHCDVKPANLLLDYTAQRVKLADFGAAELLEEKRRSSDNVRGDVGAGTLAYNPPEHYSRQACSFALDMWQAGCCVLAMCTGRRPWRHLFMDPHPHINRLHLNRLKRNYGTAIGQETRGHMLPCFLDTTIHKLLYGCLHSDPQLRLTAVECWRLLAFTEELNELQRMTVSDVVGYSSHVPSVLRAREHTPPCVDVFLGSCYDGVMVNGYRHALNPGWVGSVPYQQDMTYGELYHEIYTSAFPVLATLGPTNMAVTQASPQELFVATSPSQSSRQRLFTPVDRTLHLDPSKALVLLKAQQFSQRKTSF